MSHPPHRARSLSPGGIPTSLLVQLFSDRVSVTISQLGKVGTTLLATCDVSPTTERRSYDVTVLLGRRDDPLLSIYARQLIEKVKEVDPAPGRDVLLCISLKEEGRDSGSFQELLNATLEMFVEML
jgi:proteasome assembly chaperone 3